jgi:hypothetical protein
MLTDALNVRTFWAGLFVPKGMFSLSEFFRFAYELCFLFVEGLFGLRIVLCLPIFPNGVDLIVKYNYWLYSPEFTRGEDECSDSLSTE